MSKTRQIGANVFTGGLDTDSDPHVISNQDYIDAYDILNGYGGQIGAISFLRGNSRIAYTLPAGINRCIGAPEDKQTASAFMFIYNSNDDHQILWWKPNDPTEDVRVLAEGATLNFSITQFISQAAIVDGKLLYWTDGQYVQGQMRGNPPRMLDVETADLTEKNRAYEVYAGIPGEDQFQAGNEYTFKIVNESGDELIMETFTADGTYENDPVGGLQWLYDGLLASSLSPYLSLNYCECKLEITVLTDMVPEGYNILDLTMVSATNGDIVLVGINFYPTPLEAYHLDLIKQPAHCAPSGTYVGSTLTTLNNVDTLCAQFAVRYIYRDGARSAWSPYSNIALNTDISGEIIPSLNAIEVDFSDDRLKDPSWLFLIRSVEVAFRDGNTNEFKLIDRFDVCEIGIQRQVITFLNDKLYSNVESDDLSVSPDIQVLKLFDSVPLVSGALATAADSNGNNMLFLGSNLEGYDCPDCVEMEVTAEEWDDECLIDIKGTVNIINDAAYPAADPDYSAYPLGGFVVYLAGTNYYAISDNPADGSGIGSFTIPNVPRGFYVLRVASYKCSFNNDLGERYNLGNGLEWQRTSAPVIECAGSLTDGWSQYERVVDLTLVADELDLDTVTGYGPIEIANAHWSNRFTEKTGSETFVNFQEFYVLDNNASDADADTRIAALNCEIQQLYYNTYAGVQSLITDHNGYVFFADVQPADVPGVGGTVDLQITSGTPGDFATIAVYRGDYKEMYDDTLVVDLIIEPTENGGNHFVINTDEQVTNAKRVLQTSAIDLNSVPLPGVLFVYTRTTRTSTTTVEGIAQILCYAQYDDDFREIDFLIANYPDDICYEHYPANPILVEDFEIVYLLGMNIDPKIVAAFEFSLAGGMSLSARFLKAGGVYDFGIVYEDAANRTCGVSKGPRFYVPFHTNGLTRYQAKWSISSVPPDWAHHFRIVRTRNAIHQSYVQWSLGEVQYVRIPSDLEDPIETTFLAGDYTHLLFRLFVPDPASTDNQLTLFWQQDGQEGYYPQQGDVVRLILDQTGEPVNTATILYQSEIVGTFINDAGEVYAIVNPSFGSVEVKAGFLVEYLTPRQNVEEVYYEGGEDCYFVLDPYFENRRHAGPITNQVIVGGETTVPATGMVTGGDTYWRRQLFTDTAAFITEHNTTNRLQTAPCEDIGRAFIYDGDAAQIYFYNRVRFSGKYVPNSNVNDLPSFGSLDYQDINRQFGHITWLGLVNNVLLCVCQFKVQPLYVSQNQLLDMNGQISVGRSDRILNIANASVSNLGSNNPESIVVEDGRLYAWDGYQGVPWQYSQAGVESIADTQINFFRTLGRSRFDEKPNFVVGGYDRRHAMWILSGLPSKKLTAFTIGYDTAKGRWSSKFNYLPEMFVRVGQNFGTFKDGGLWLHHAINTHSNWYGVQYKPYVTFVCNAVPGAVKLFYSLRVITNRLWTAPTITIPRSMDYNSGMESRLKGNKFVKYEGVYAANFLRDMLDTSAVFLAIPDVTLRKNTALLEGRMLRGEVIIIKLEADNGAVATLLNRVDTYFVLSEETNS